MTADRPHEPARSGWCLTRDHDRCVWSGCHCSCHYGTPNVVGTQRDVWDNRGSKTAPGDAPTSTGSLAPLPHYRKEA